MKKILYITDREEYSEHNFIGPLFEKYLSEYLQVDIVYFSSYKSYLGQKDRCLIIPEFKKKNMFKCLEDNNINISSYDYIIVRNMHDVLKYVLENKNKYNIKVGFRLSFPKITGELERAKAENRSNLVKVINHKLRTYSKSQLINQCDIFLPTSKQMQEVYYPNIKTKIFVIPSAIDPQRLHDKVSRNDKKIIFAYEGTLSKLRNFEVVLEAFCTIKKDNWELHISTKDMEYAKEYVKSSSLNQDKIKISKATTKDELLNFITRCDVGLSLLPDISIFNTSVHLKIMDYYTSGVPSLMSNNAQNSSIFTDEKDAWLCDFNIKAISQKLEKIIDTPKDKIRAMGKAGQERLLDVRNYKIIAKKLSNALNEI